MNILVADFNGTIICEEVALGMLARGVRQLTPKTRGSPFGRSRTRLRWMELPESVKKLLFPLTSWRTSYMELYEKGQRYLKGLIVHCFNFMNSSEMGVAS